MSAGSVLFHAPSHVFQAPGGGENQLVQTGRHLEDRGMTVRLFSPWTDRLADARLLHLFGMSREGLELARVARAAGVPVVLSPICWFEPRAIAALAAGPARRAFDLAKWGLKVVAPRLPSWRRALLAAADAILPNSEAEARQLVRLFGLDPRAIHVVPNGVRPEFALASAIVLPLALRVGRFRPLRRPGRTAEERAGADRGTPDDGAPAGRHRRAPSRPRGYARRCRRAGRGFVRWLGRLEHDDPLLASAYAAARVFALPSWFETPGLAALEAALAGCAVVVTPFGCTREYFGDRVAYARPDRPAEIGRAILRAWRDGPDSGLAAHVTSHYLWSHVARRTAEVYDQVAG